MTNELTMLLSGHGLAQIRDASILSYIPIKVAQYYSPGNRRVRALGNPRNVIGISGTSQHTSDLTIR